MHLWTIQNRQAWKRLIRQEFLHSDERRPPRKWRAAYSWMARQMVKRGLMPRPRFPIWRWYQPKPDLRHSGHLPPGARGVRLELKVPAGRVLLSHFEGWHCVLNGWYVPFSWNQDREFDRLRRKLDAAGCLRPGNPPASLRRRIRKSWGRIFDWKRLDRFPLWRTRDGKPRVQAVLREIRLSDVVRMEAFISK